jgi:thioredoxin-like negative regulator of GroEL
VATRTPRMAQLEALIAADPADPELRYFLAMEYASARDEATAAELLLRLTADSTYVPAFLQAGQILNRLNRVDESCAALRKGIVVARQKGDTHAEGEMAGLLATME